MAKIIESLLDSVDVLLAWLSTSLKQTNESYCDLETADSPTVLVGHDGALASIIRVHGVTHLVGTPEFNRLHQGLSERLRAALIRPGHAVQVYFSYDKQDVENMIRENYEPARQTALRLELNLDDLFEERAKHLAKFCAEENMFFVLWTRPNTLSTEQYQRAQKLKLKTLQDGKIPPLKNTQNIMATIPDLRETHDSFVRAMVNDLSALNVRCELLDVHTALYEVRRSVDPEFTDYSWRPYLPGDKIPVRETKRAKGDVSDILWPPLAQQLMPRDAENIDLRTTRVGDRIYSCVFVELFPKEIKYFVELFRRTLPTEVPWRMSFLMESEGLKTLGAKSTIAQILSFSSSHNRLIHDATQSLRQLELSGDDAVIKLRVAAATWAPDGDIRLLRMRSAELAKAIEGWGNIDISEVSGDPFGGVVSTMMGICSESVATASVAPLSDIIYMLPITRPASPWDNGALLFRSPDGKPWPFQPGSSMQTTWIDILYARPGSGKSVLSNAINLATCLLAGIQRLPRIAIVDIGPSSSGLISLLKEALPENKKHLVAYHRLRMTPDYSVNPFDTQLGCRYPTPQERSFLVNFLTLLSTPIGSQRPYDGVTDMAGLVVDEMYKQFSDNTKPSLYTANVDFVVDKVLEEMGFVQDQHTTWWEVTDALFDGGFIHEATLAQRYAMPLLADAAAICRTPAIEDLYGNIIAPTGENLITAFSRMISSAVREYPILSRVTAFDLGDARIVSLDLDEVAKSGGEAAERQTAVMYMLARQILAKHYYLTEDNVADMPANYQAYHKVRITEIREDPKRIVYDEFHRTSKAAAVREQVILDMREGRKWKVQIAVISQSLDDFDSVMVEFATSIFIMDAGPAQTVKKATDTFGLSDTSVVALKTRVHGPREEGSTFLASFATKDGVNSQLLTSTIGPIELWAFSTTADDANLRNRLYKALGPKEARRVLANLFPSGSVSKEVERRLQSKKESGGIIEEEASVGVVNEIASDILRNYSENPNMKSLHR